MERSPDQLRYPRVSVSSVRVAAPSSPEMYHRPFQTPRTSTSSPALSREHSARPSPIPAPLPLPPFPDHPVHPVALNNRLSKEAAPTVFGLPLKYVSWVLRVDPLFPCSRDSSLLASLRSLFRMPLFLLLCTIHESLPPLPNHTHPPLPFFSTRSSRAQYPLVLPSGDYQSQTCRDPLISSSAKLSAPIAGSSLFPPYFMLFKIHFNSSPSATSLSPHSKSRIR